MCVRKVDGWARTHAAHHCGEQLLSGVLFGVGVRDMGDLSNDLPLRLEEEFSLKHSLLVYFCLIHELQIKSTWKWDSTIGDFCVSRLIAKEGLDLIRILFCWCFSRIWHISGSNKRISQRQTRLRRGRPVKGLGNLCGAGHGLSYRIGAATAVTEREPWWTPSYWYSAGLWSLRWWELRMTRSRSSWRGNASWSATLTRPRIGRLRPLRSAFQCAPPTPRWLSLQSGATTMNRRRWATKQE